jgi:2-dehydro-3-deoxyphosphooctonate aldolase (KDO 8-P synthase)
MKAFNFSFQKLAQRLRDGELLIIAGPSLLDDKQLASETADQLQTMAASLGVILIYKSAFKRVNSAVSDTFEGLGAETALKHLKAVGKQYQIPVQTDVYNELDVFVAAKYADILQIPAYLFRETSLLEAAAKTGKVVNIRKGMTIKGREMAEAVLKINRKGASHIILTERGTMHGYEDVVVDFRNMMVMLKNNAPVLIDLSNTVALRNPEIQEYDALQTALTLGKAAIATGACGVVLDAHSRPAIARASAGYCFQVTALESVIMELADFKRTLTPKS